MRTEFSLYFRAHRHDGGTRLRAEIHQWPLSVISVPEGERKKGAACHVSAQGVIMVVATSALRSSCTLLRSPSDWNG